MPRTMREELEESFEKAEQEAGGSEEDSEESLGGSSEEEEAGEERQPGEESDSDVDRSDDEGGEEEDDSSGDVSEDSDKSGDEESSKEATDEESDSKESGDAKAPVSWKPSVREHWKKLPKEVQGEVLRREAEIQKGLQQASGYKKVANEYFSVVKPYQHLIQAQNSTPAQAITNMMQTAARLTMGNTVQKAEVITEIIKNYGVDLETLDGVLAGEDFGDADDAPLLKKLDEKLRPFQDFMTNFSGAQENENSRIQTQVDSELEEFSSDSKHEFYEDVREDMADLMELAARRGRSMTLEDAYGIACQNNPEIKKVVDYRAAKKRAARPSQEDLDRKRAASTSLPNQGPSGASSSKENLSLRDSIASAFDETDE